jgi:hypothetical protein
MYVWISKMVKINIPLRVTFSKNKSSKLEGLFYHVSGKRDFRALSFEFWNSIRKCHPKWDWLYLDDWQWIQKCKPIPLGVTFSNAVSSSKIKARTSLFTETWQKRCSSFELWAFENDTPSGIDCTFISFLDCILSIVRFTVYWSVCVSWNRDVSVECWMMSAKVLCSLLTLYEWLRAHAFSRTHYVQVFKLTDSSVVLFTAPCTRHGQCWQRCMLASLVCEASSRPSWIDWPRVDCAN